MARGWRPGIWLRLAFVSAFALVLFRSGTLLADTWSHLRALEMRWFWLGLALHLTSLAAGALRLGFVLRAAGFVRHWSSLMIDVLQGTALNASLLMGSGEMWRIHRLAAAVPLLAQRSLLVVFDRLLGVAAFAIAGGLAWLVYGLGPSLQRAPSPWEISLVVLAAIAAFAVAWRLRHLATAHFGFSRRPGPWFGVVASTTAGAACWICAVILFASSLGLTVSPRALMYAAPLAAMASLLPVSIGGLGVREGVYVALLSPWGVTASEAIALGLVQYAGFLVASLIGAASLLISGPDARGSIRAAVDPKRSVPL